MEEPEKIVPKQLSDYLEVLSKAVFQTGISWQVVDKKWPGIREAFQGFDPQAVASLPPWEVDNLTNDARIIRNRRKIEATIGNAQTMLALESEHQGFHNYLRSHGGFEQTVADLRRRFRFLGDSGAYYFLWVVNEDVPSYDEWCASRGRTPHTVDTTGSARKSSVK